LLSCIVAWRRAVLEARCREDPAEAKALDERRDLLCSYADVAGGVDPLTRHILGLAVGSLAEPLFLEGLYRIETASSIAWALGLAEAVPPITEHANHERLGALFPTASAPPPSIREARLRERAEIAAKLEEWKDASSRAWARREEAPGEVTGIEFSRAYERARGLRWVCSRASWIEEIQGG